MKWHCFGVVFWCVLQGCAQDAPRWKFVANLDNRFSTIGGDQVTLLGLKAGVQYRSTWRFGLGVSGIVNPVTFHYTSKKTSLPESNVVSFWYGSVYADWVLHHSPHWEIFLTEQAGFGKPSFKHEVNDEVVSDLNIPLYVNELSGQVNYKIWKGVGVGTGIGYRHLWNQKAALRNLFDAPIYIVKITLYPEDWWGH